jgi:hypothetical protein
MNDTNILDPQTIQENRLELTPVTKIPITDWSELEWFDVWLHLARPADSDARLTLSVN